MKQIPPGRNGRPALTKDEIAAEFTHHALLFGVVPIYYNVHTRIYCVRNGWPRAYSELVINLVVLFWRPLVLLSPSYQPSFWIRLGKPTR